MCLPRYQSGKSCSSRRSSASARAGLKRAFFLEGEDVYVANEGDIVKKRYKVVRVNLNSVVMEDTEYKQQQTLPLTEQSQ